MSSIFANLALLSTLSSGFTTVESHVAHKKAEESVVLRKTSSNPIVGSKRGSSAGAKKRVVKGPADDSEPKDAGLSEEDDAWEREAAMSSPLKGTDSCGSAKVSSQFLAL